MSTTEINDNQKIVRKFYMSTLSIYNVMNTLEDESLLNKSWTLGLTDLQKNVQWIEDEMITMQYSLDYKQATTFKSYVKVVLYLIGNLKDELIGKNEGLPTIQIAKKLLVQSFSPFSAFICKRVNELNVLPFIPETYRRLYYSYNEDFSQSDNESLTKLFELAFEDSESIDEIEALELEVEEYFKGKISLDDLNVMRELISTASKRNITESNLTLDF